VRLALFIDGNGLYVCNHVALCFCLGVFCVFGLVCWFGAEGSWDPVTTFMHRMIFTVSISFPTARLWGLLYFLQCFTYFPIATAYGAFRCWDDARSTVRPVCFFFFRFLDFEFRLRFCLLPFMSNFYFLRYHRRVISSNCGLFFVRMRIYVCMHLLYALCSGFLGWEWA